MALQIFQQCKSVKLNLRRGREGLEVDPKSGRPATATIKKNTDRFHYMMMGDMQLNINYIANAICIFRERIDNIQHNELGMTEVCARWAPQFLTPENLTLRQIHLVFLDVF